MRDHRFDFLPMPLRPTARATIAMLEGSHLQLSFSSVWGWPDSNQQRSQPSEPTAGSRPTPEEQIDQVLAAVRDVLGPDLVGAYLHGSAVLGGLRPRSDIDVLAVSRRPTTKDEKRRLVERLVAITGTTEPGPPWTVELTIVIESQIRPWRYPPPMDFQYGEWVRREFERGNFEPWPARDPDLALLITIVLHGNRPLLGPPPTEIFDPVPRLDCTRAMLDGLDGLLDRLDEDTRNVLLTLGRIWCTLATGEIRAKDAAADWALRRLPEEHRAVLARARAIYLGEEEERWDDIKPLVRPHADYVVATIKRLAAEPSPNDRESQTG
jgi:predicted nucleotidyltransferase